MADNPGQDQRGFRNAISKSKRPRGGSGVPHDLDRSSMDTNSVTTGYPSAVSRSSKPAAGEPGIQGKVPRGYVHNEPSFQPSTRKFGNLKKGSVS